MSELLGIYWQVNNKYRQLDEKLDLLDDGADQADKERNEAMVRAEMALGNVIADHDSRIKVLEKDNETRVSYISVQPNMSKFQFTQADLDAAVKAEREKIKKRVLGLPYRDDFPKAWLRRGEVWKAIELTDDS